MIHLYLTTLWISTESPIALALSTTGISGHAATIQMRISGHAATIQMILHRYSGDFYTIVRILINVETAF